MARLVKGQPAPVCRFCDRPHWPFVLCSELGEPIVQVPVEPLWRHPPPGRPFEMSSEQLPVLPSTNQRPEFRLK